MSRANYGFDAPGVMRTLLLSGAAAIVAGLFLFWFASHRWQSVSGVLLVAIGGLLWVPGSMMVAYGVRGKMRVRDRMLDSVVWTGQEAVLDIGTGSGLLAIGAAKRLTTGHVVGIDVWRAEDLTHNTAATTRRNAELEGVSTKVIVQDGDARQLAFPDGTFDRVVSLFCLHNIEPAAEQMLACSEIARVLKPGGYALLGDFVPVTRYADALRTAGMRILQQESAWITAFGPTWLVFAQKVRTKAGEDEPYVRTG